MNSLSVESVIGISIAMAQILRIIFQQIKKTTVDIENKQIEEIIKLIKSTKNKGQKAFIGGLNILKKGDKVIMLLK